MRKLNLAILADAVTLKLYNHAVKSGGRLSIDELSASFSVTVTSTFVKNSMQRVRNQNLVDCNFNLARPYEINSEGIEYVQRQLADQTSWIYRLQEAGDGWLEEVEDDPAAGTGSLVKSSLDHISEQHLERLTSGDFNYVVPSADGYVEIDHNSRDFNEVNEALNGALEAIKGHNHPVDYHKEVVVSELEAARVLLKSPTVRIGTIVATAVSPLYTVYNDVGAEALKPLMMKAIEAIKVLLGFV